MSHSTETPVSAAIRVRRARIHDIPGIMAILDYYLVSKKTSIIPAELEKTGFLLNSFTAEDAKAAIADKTNFFFFIATNQDEVIGYALGCDLKKLNPAFTGKIAAISSEMNHILSYDKVFFLKQIAKKPAKNHVGMQLIETIEAEAMVYGYHYIIGYIAAQPIKNTSSMIFHEKQGYSCAGYIQSGQETGAIYWKKL
jgi:L-amino acid N-acyltransferase YncA